MTPLNPSPSNQFKRPYGPKPSKSAKSAKSSKISQLLKYPPVLLAAISALCISFPETLTAQSETTQATPQTNPSSIMRPLQPEARVANPQLSPIPNISIIGNMVTTISDTGTPPSDFNVQEIEIFYQDYIHPQIKATISTAFHTHDGEGEFALEEAYLSFTDTLNPILGKGRYPSWLNFNTVLGKKKIGFGKYNALHPEQWDFITLPTPVSTFLGEEGYTGQGIQFNTLLPVPFFSQLEVGVWKQPNGHSHEEEGEEHEHEAVTQYYGPTYSTRLWNSISISDKELEFGFSNLVSKPYSIHSEQKTHTMGLDITLSKPSVWSWKTEWINNGSSGEAAHHDDHEEEEEEDHHETTWVNRSGFYTEFYYNLNRYFKSGIRLEHLQKGPQDETEHNALTFLMSKRLTELTRLKGQYTINNTGNNTVLIQIVFGMGPHSHVLQ